jgi:uncharacterized membrane protein HdeD (DUF308 family)
MSAHRLMEETRIAETTRKHAAWSIFMGVLDAAVGVFLILYPLATAKVTTVLLGWALMFVGVAQFVFALHSQTPRNFFLRIIGAALFGITGIALAFAPMAGVEALTGLLGTLLLVQAGLATVTASQIRPLAGWGWFLADAVISLILGTLILVKWPSSSLWAIGTFVGVAVLVGGVARIMIAAKLRSGASTAERSLYAA